jgi:hypothetical protein
LTAEFADAADGISDETAEYADHAAGSVFSVRSSWFRGQKAVGRRQRSASGFGVSNLAFGIWVCPPVSCSLVGGACLQAKKGRFPVGACLQAKGRHRLPLDFARGPEPVERASKLLQFAPDLNTGDSFAPDLNTGDSTCRKPARGRMLPGKAKRQRPISKGQTTNDKLQTPNPKGQIPRKQMHLGIAGCLKWHGRLAQVRDFENTGRLPVPLIQDFAVEAESGGGR